MNYIRLREVISDMDRLDGDGKGIPFDIKFVSTDLKRKTGGDIITISGARKSFGRRKSGEVSDTPHYVKEGSAEKRDPHHFVNQTRNLLLPNGQIRKVHIRLIIEFNGKKVCF